ASSYESTGTGPHGSTSHYECRVGPVREHGRIVALMIIAHDITGRVEMEQRLRDSRDQLEVAVAASGLGLWEWDVEHDTHTWSDLLLQIYQRAPGQAPRSYAELLDLIHPDDREHMRRQF